MEESQKPLLGWISKLGRASLLLSYGLCFLVTAVLLGAVAEAYGPKGHLSAPGLALLFLGAFLWQVFTVYHHRRARLSWFMAISYGIATLVFTLAALTGMWMALRQTLNP